MRSLFLTGAAKDAAVGDGLEEGQEYVVDNVDDTGTHQRAVVIVYVDDFPGGLCAGQCRVLDDRNHEPLEEVFLWEEVGV